MAVGMHLEKRNNLSSVFCVNKALILVGFSPLHFIWEKDTFEPETKCFGTCFQNTLGQNK